MDDVQASAAGAGAPPATSPVPLPDAAALASFSLVAPPPGFVDDPYPWYAALRQHAPCHRLGPDSWLLTRHADVLAVYRFAGASSDKREEFAPRLQRGSPIYEHHTSSLVFSDPPLHTRVRRILMGALTPRAITRLQADVQVLLGALVQRLRDADTPCLIHDFAAQIPVEVIGNLLAVPHAEREPLRDWSLAILSALEPAPDAAVLARANAAVVDFCDALRQLVAERRRRPGDPETDVLTRLLQGDDQGQLSETELLHNCIFLLNAGHETTTNLIGNGLHALLTHRDQWERLSRQPTLLPGAVEELLRFESPLQLNNRRLLQPLPLGDTVLPAGSLVTLCIGSANRDPAAFADPDRLDITRRPNPHLAFGQGSHACSGMNVARMEARLALQALCEQLPGLHLAGEPRRDRRVRFRGWQTLPARLG